MPDEQPALCRQTDIQTETTENFITLDGRYVNEYQTREKVCRRVGGGAEKPERETERR